MSTFKYEPAKRRTKAMRDAEAMRNSLNRTRRLIVLAAIVLASIFAFGVYMVGQSIVYDAKRVQQTLENDP